jgi:hypothetical protein
VVERLVVLDGPIRFSASVEEAPVELMRSPFKLKKMAGHQGEDDPIQDCDQEQGEAAQPLVPGQLRGGGLSLPALVIWVGGRGHDT